VKVEKEMPISILLSIFLISFSCLGYEISLTRIFSLIFSHYYIFLSLSVAMFGVGIGGFLASVIKFKDKDLIIISLLLAISFPLSILIPFRFVFLLSHPLLLSLSFVPPFMLTSLFIALVFKFFHSFSGTIYFSDLLGASVGSLIIVLLLFIFSPINVMFIFSFCVLLSTFLLSRKILFSFFHVVVVLFLFFNMNHRLIDVPYQNIPQTEGTKVLIKFLKDEKVNAEIEKTYWNPSFRTDVIYRPNSPDTRGIFVDGGAPTIMFKFSGDVNSLKWFENSLNFFPFLIVEKKDVLSIGPGGGVDILLGRLANSEVIEAVEINSSIPEILRDYREFNGNIMESDKLTFFVGEGRNYLKKRNKNYDLIYLSLAQTSSASKMGLPLVESYLHTSDAFVDYLSHLKSNGYVAVICETQFFLQRTILNILFALKETGIEFKRGKDHLIIIENFLPDSPYRYLLLLKKNALSLGEITYIWDRANEKGLIPKYFPYRYQNMPVDFSSVYEIRNFIKEIRINQGIDISPTTDEKPFFYDLSPKLPSYLYGLCIFTLALSLLALPLIKNRRSLALSPYFFLLGVGFMLIEVSLIQKFLFFLGYPLTTFSVILFSLLLGCGWGGFISQKMVNPLKKLPLILSVLCPIILCTFLFLNDVFLILFSLHDFLKVICSFALLLPLGLLLGIQFPTLMRQVGKTSSYDVGLMWGINGLMSIFGSSLSVIISKTFGFRYSLLLSFLIYTTLLVLSSRLHED
jgi:predicted membrane-bound spermidine synthase